MKEERSKEKMPTFFTSNCLLLESCLSFLFISNVVCVGDQANTSV